MTKRRFYTLDVFTAAPLAGNPLAVVLDAEGLDNAAMQAIAGEFNLSETVFVLPADNPRQRAQIRIFTPEIEMPFAGHPTVGTASLLALLDGGGARAFGLALAAGDVACIVDCESDRSARARFRSPGLPKVYAPSLDRLDVAVALGLDPVEIGAGAHEPSMHGVALPMAFAPVAAVAALARIKPDCAMINRLNPEHGAIYPYARAGEGLHFRSRMFAPGAGVAEDPATGSAVAGFAGVLMQFEKLGDGEHDVVVEQGVEMGRPSRIEMQMTIANGALTGVEIGGQAVIVAEGVLRL
ncbi:MAG: PhzF family phenazine biosynthesis protein [Caulobacterales bacterium]|jgi:trans-2,3-dihydro-3-hydroxyanthranilate isomerase